MFARTEFFNIAMSNYGDCRTIECPIIKGYLGLPHIFRLIYCMNIKIFVHSIYKILNLKMEIHSKM